MPGAPNRPPEKGPEAPPPVSLTETPQQKALRRLGPSRVALLLDAWKGAPNPELTAPLEKAETAYRSGDFAGAVSALELLSVRFAEPRWPTLPEPFRLLRVPIPAPMPPHWNPEHALGPAEKETRRARRVADEQLSLATACVAWSAAHGVAADDLARWVAEAQTLLANEGASTGFYERIDAVWNAVRDRVPMPKSGSARAAAPAPTVAEAEEA